MKDIKLYNVARDATKTLKGAVRLAGSVGDSEGVMTAEITRENFIKFYTSKTQMLNDVDSSNGMVAIILGELSLSDGTISTYYISNSKVSANWIPLSNGYYANLISTTNTAASQQEMNGLQSQLSALSLSNQDKEPKINKKSGFNLDKSDSINLDDSNTLATSKAVNDSRSNLQTQLNNIQLTWDRITGKPSIVHSVTNTSTTDFATPGSVKTAYDLAAAANSTANAVNSWRNSYTFWTTANLNPGLYLRKDTSDTMNGNLTVTGWIRGSVVYNAVWNDYAELFEKDISTNTNPGDIIALDIDSKEERYKLATENDVVVVGVHSDEYGILLGGDGNGDNYNHDLYVPVGLAGRVRVKFRGVAKKGMKVVPSDIPGVGREFRIGDNINNVVGVITEDDLSISIRRVRMFIRR